MWQLTTCGQSPAAHAPRRRYRVLGPALLAWAAACSTNTSEVPDATPGGAQPAGAARPACRSERVVFATEVWGPWLSTDCLGCHVSHGLAPQAGSPFELWDSSQAGYMAHNLAQVRAEAAKTQDGQSVLLAKPLGELDHGGGERITAGDPRYQALVSFLADANFDASCDLALTDAQVASQTVQLSDSQVLRKAALQLAARLPTPAETAMVGSGRLDQALASVMASPTFGDWVMRVFDDTFLNIGFNVNNVGIDIYSYDDGIARNSGTASDGTQWPNGFQLYWYATHAPSGVDGVDDHETVMYGLSTLGLQLARYLATTGGDWRDILNANYLLLSPWTARSFSSDFSFDLLGKVAWKNVNDPNEYQPIALNRDTWPTAGLLTDPGFLKTFSTTITNRNRKRANTIHNLFLGLDVLTLGTQPPNLSTLLAKAAEDPSAPPPFMSNNECLSCHKIIDPLAANFAPYNDNINFHPPSGDFGPYTMFAAGFEGTAQPTEAAAHPAAWVARQVTNDPRFVTSQLRWWLRALTALDPLGDPPANSALPEADLAAKTYQEAIFARVGEAFVQSGYNVQVLIAGLVDSPYYRTVDAKDGASAEDLAMLSSLASTRWVGADAINNKLLAALGTTWTTPNPQWNHWGFLNQPLVREYESILGSIDPSNNVTQANLSPTGMMVRVATTMGSVVACQAVAADLALPAARRVIFREADASTTPDTPAGAASIAGDIRSLLGRLTGLEGASLEAEAETAGALFRTAYGNAKAAGNVSLPRACQAQGLTEDPTFAVQAWLTTMAYILTDPLVVME